MNRISELDSLRGLAALAVLLFHYTTRFDQIYGHPIAPLFQVSYGFLGVELFFMISGFVIFMTLTRIRTGFDFVVSRFSRLFPTYWMAIFITFTAVTVFSLPGKAASVHDMLINLTMMQGLFNIKDVDGVYWTLQIEMFFYIIMFVLYKTNMLPHIRLVLIVWFTLRLIYFGAEQFSIHLPYLFSEILILPFIPLFGLGILFYSLQTKVDTNKTYAMICACLLVIGITDTVAIFLAALGGSILFTLLLRRQLGFLSHSILVFLGTISYSLYLLHENIGFIILRAFYRIHLNSNIAIILTAVLMIFIAAILTFTVEKPCLRFIRRRYKSYRTQVLQETAT